MHVRWISGLIVAVLVASSTVKAGEQPGPAPDASAFLGWEPNPDFTARGAALGTFKRIQVDCQTRDLFPTHPQQTTKTYHISLLGRYDHFRLKAGDEACAFGSKIVNSRGFLPCLRPDSAEFAVISDFYQDRCGKFYRGFWSVQFLRKNETMGTLFSEGRTMYQDPKSQIANDMYVGDSYKLGESDFLFLAQVTENEERLIKREKAAALKTHRYDASTLLFTLKKRP